MTDPARELERALRTVADGWDAARTERTLSGLHHKQRRRSRQRRWSSYGTAAVSCALLVLWFGRTPAVQPKPPAPSSLASDPLRLQLSDGSRVSLRDAQTRVVVTQAADASAKLDLELDMSAGQAQFDVVHRDQRTFRVHCGDVVVKVLGTSFELERDGARTRVAVSRGRVAVEWSTGQTELSAGEAGWFPRAAEVKAPTVEATPHPAKRSPRRPSAVANAWRAPAEQGDFDRAYELLARVQQTVADDVEELLLAADTARLSGHPQAALPFLKRVIAQHPSDSRASLAAFTLGGVLMQQLGQPREAEAAYARARALSLNPSLSEDALARQVEAAHRAGDAAHARALAREYLASYPQGRRVHAVQRFGGL